MNGDPLGAALAACAAARREPDAEAITAALSARGIDAPAVQAMVQRVNEDPASQAALRTLKGEIDPIGTSGLPSRISAPARRATPMK